MPGPKEQTLDQVQRFLRPIISDLLRLWKHGIKVPTESHPEGRLVRVALVAVVCDKPAVHKMGGFASHSHTNFCTGCWISTEDKGKPSAFQRNGKSFSIDFACTVEIVTHQGSYQGLINNSARLVTSIMHSLTRQPA
jgi:hypothetical protein